MIRLKSARQLEGIRRSAQVLATVLSELEEMVQPGLTTGDLDRYAQKRLKEFDAKPSFLGYHGFPGALCTSINDEVIHGIPGDRVIREGDVVGIDCGVILDGFYSDSAITVAVGDVAPGIQHLIDTTRLALERGIAAAAGGKRINDISRAIWEAIHPAGFGVVRPYVGHGVGLAIHEDPQVPNYLGRGPNPRLKPGMVLAIEPMVNLGSDDVEVLDDDWTVVTADGSVSVHFEHTVAIVSGDAEVLTRRPNEVPIEVENGVHS